jgi:hypothetical protein
VNNELERLWKAVEGSGRQIVSVRIASHVLFCMEIGNSNSPQLCGASNWNRGKSFLVLKETALGSPEQRRALFE